MDTEVKEFLDISGWSSQRVCCFHYKLVDHQWGQDEIICEMSADGKEDTRGWSPGALQHPAIRRKYDKPAKETEEPLLAGRPSVRDLIEIFEYELPFQHHIKGEALGIRNLWLSSGDT